MSDQRQRERLSELLAELEREKGPTDRRVVEEVRRAWRIDSPLAERDSLRNGEHMSPRDALHRLIDDLPERNLPEASRVLGALRDTADRADGAVGEAPRDLSGRSNGLARLAGTWSAEEFDAFETAVAETERVDEELWR